MFSQRCRHLIIPFLCLLFVGIRIIPLISNNFYFTADQGRDAVYVRDILVNHHLFLLGPETTIRGLFTLPLWYYFASIGYLLTGGHPVGGIIILIALNLAVAVYLAKYYRRPSLLLFLTFSWSYYHSTRFSFNPFPLVALSILLVIFQVEKKLRPSLLIVFLAANFNLVGAFIFAIFTIICHFLRPKLPSDLAFIFYSLVLSIITVVFLAFSPIHRDWYSVFLPPLLLISLLLAIHRLPRQFQIITLSLCFLVNASFFANRYLPFLTPSSDRSILVNQLKVIDWVYQRSSNLGFDAYVYTDSFYDYQYQYLFWWYGLKKYGYLPWEYANYPSAGKSYIPGTYSQPAKEGNGQFFLISDSTTNGNDNKNWISTYRSITTLLDQANIGPIHLEHRLRQSPYYEFTNQRLNYRQYREIGVEVEVPEYWEITRLPDRLFFVNPSKTITIDVTRNRIGSHCPVLDPADSCQSRQDSKHRYQLLIKPIGIMSQAQLLLTHITSSFRPIQN